MLVQVSETPKAKGRQGLEDGIGQSVWGQGVKAIKNAVLSAFDKANQDNVVKSLPSIIGAPSTNTGNSGNSNGNSG